MERIYNFRDFGGYQNRNGSVIKKGLLYRSGSLEKASDHDLQRLSELGIRTVCDLRTLQEKERWPDRFPRNSHVKTFHFPIKVSRHKEAGFVAQLFSLLFGETRKLNYALVTQDAYREYVTDFRSEFSEIIKLAAEPTNLPILIHCAAGKDRTGFACSLLHLMLAIPQESVLADYLLSNEYLNEFKVAMLNKLKVFHLLGVSKQKFMPLLDARSEYLQAAFDQIHRDYGTIEGYFHDGLGILAEERTRLNEALLERAD